MNVDISIPAQSVTIPSQDVTASIPAAQIVYQSSYLNQTENIPTTAIFTPSGPGLFRLTAVVYAEGNDGSILHVDALISQATVSTFNPVTASGYWNSSHNPPSNNLSASLVFIGDDAVPVQLSAAIGVSSGTLNHYNVYIVIEQLQ